jgi:hypothetical protein
MSKYTLSKGLLTGINRIKKQGVTHFKVELEAQLNREDGHPYCNSCDEGTVDCYECDGSGVVETTAESPNGRTLNLTTVCTYCDGDGYETCGDCEGDYEGSSDGWDEDTCADFILDYVSSEARTALTFYRFYNDMSVDSEFTYTLAVENAHYAPEFVDAFNALAEAIGRGMDTSGAGMHIAVMTDGNYNDLPAWNDAKLNNLMREMPKIMAPLYFAAAPDQKSRALFPFREPRISTTKYSAIHVGRGFLEYRVFETCYQKPAMLLEDFEVIANTLKYYSDKTINLPVRNITTQMYERTSSGLVRHYQSAEALQALNQGLPLIKPAGKTITAMKAERNFTLTVKELVQKAKTAVPRSASVDIPF